MYVVFYSSGRVIEGIQSQELKPPLADEIKDGQWLGVTVRSQGPGAKVMVSDFSFSLFEFIDFKNFQVFLTHSSTKFMYNIFKKF